MILVGEMRDLETIHTALTAAETGHLVFATLHTQDAPQSVDRIIDVFPPDQQQQMRVQLATALQGVVTQQLVPTVRRQGPGRGRRGAGRHARGPQPHPGGQGPPDPYADAGGREVRHGDDGPVPRRSSCGRHRITLDIALERPPTPRTSATCSASRPTERARRCPRPTPTRSATGPAKSVEGSLEAESEQLVDRKLREMGYVPISVKQRGRSMAAADKSIGGTEGQPEGRRGLLPPVRDDDQLPASR